MGGVVTVSDKAVINGNLFLAGTSLQVNGKVTGSVFGGSRDMAVGPIANVGRNLYYGGYSLETKPGSLVSIDVFMGGYQAILAGTIGRDLNMAGGALQLDGTVTRNATVDIGSPSGQSMNFKPMNFFQQPGMPPMPAAISPGLHISSTATIGGTLTYTSEVHQGNAIKAQPSGGIVYQTPVPQEQPAAKPQPVEVRFPILGWLFNNVRSFVTLLILGGLALWLLPRLFQLTVVQAESKALPAAGYGFLTVVIGYAALLFAFLLVLLIGVIIFIISLGGLGRAFFGISLSSLGVVFAVFTLLVTYGSKLIVSYLIGDLLMKKVAPQASHFRIWALIVGIVLFSLVYAIPYLGWLFGVAATLVGMGAMFLVFLQQPYCLPHLLHNDWNRFLECYKSSGTDSKTILWIFDPPAVSGRRRNTFPATGHDWTILMLSTIPFPAGAPASRLRSFRRAAPALCYRVRPTTGMRHPGQAEANLPTAP